ARRPGCSESQSGPAQNPVKTRTHQRKMQAADGKKMGNSAFLIQVLYLLVHPALFSQNCRLKDSQILRVTDFFQHAAETAPDPKESIQIRPVSLSRFPDTVSKKRHGDPL